MVKGMELAGVLVLSVLSRVILGKSNSLECVLSSALCLLISLLFLSTTVNSQQVCPLAAGTPSLG